MFKITGQLFAILQKYDFSSKSQLLGNVAPTNFGCLRYCKSTIFQANHNSFTNSYTPRLVVCDTAKVRFFKQITTQTGGTTNEGSLFAILQKYDFSSKSQHLFWVGGLFEVVCDTAKVRFFKQITTALLSAYIMMVLFAILQKYDFSSKSQLDCHCSLFCRVVCDTAKVRVFKQITTDMSEDGMPRVLFAILQKYDFSSKSQPFAQFVLDYDGCLRYCKSTIFQANHNRAFGHRARGRVVCDTAKVRFFKQITTSRIYSLNAI